MAYALLQEAAKKRTEYLVIESGVDTEDVAQAELPIELVDLLQCSLSFEDDPGRIDSVRNLKYPCFDSLTFIHRHFLAIC